MHVKWSNSIMQMPYPLDCERRVTEEPPQYIHTQLEEVYISGFFGSWNHIDFAVYLLKSAVMLKRIIIDSRSKLYSRSGQSASGNSNVWSAEVWKLISNQLQGRNMSGNTEVIILWYRPLKQLWVAMTCRLLCSVLFLWLIVFKNLFKLKASNFEVIGSSSRAIS